MPDPKFTKPWHGVPREDIHWNPTILEDVLPEADPICTPECGLISSSRFHELTCPPV